MAECQHPPRRCFTGFYEPRVIAPPKPYRTARDRIEDQMWIGCCACSEIVRQAPAALRDEAAWKAQRAKGCPTCNGTGEVIPPGAQKSRDWPDEPGSYPLIACTDCEGTGRWT